MATMKTVLQLPLRVAARPSARALAQSCIRVLQWGRPLLMASDDPVACRTHVHTALTALSLLVRLTETHGDVAVAVLTDPAVFSVGEVLAFGPLVLQPATSALRAPVEVGCLARLFCSIMVHGHARMHVRDTLSHAYPCTQAHAQVHGDYA